MKNDIQTAPTSETSETSPPLHTPISSPSPFHVLASRLPEKVRDLKTRIADCGLKPSGLLGRYDPATSLLKTAQFSLIEGLDAFCAALPRTGMMQSGQLYKARPLAFSRDVPGFILLPTPIKSDAKAVNRKDRYFGNLPPGRGYSLPTYIRDGESDGIYPNPELTELLMMYPVGYTDLQVQEMPSYL